MGGGIGRFFSSTGRVGPARAALVTAVALSIGFVAMQALGWADTPGYAIGGALIGATLAKLAAEWVRRLHDTGLHGAVGLAIAAVLVVLVTGIGISDLGLDTPWLYSVALAVAALVAAVLLLRPGTAGANRWGERPSTFGHAPGPASGATRGLVWGVLSTLGGLVIGLALIGISHGMREETEKRLRFTEQQSGSRP